MRESEPHGIPPVQRKLSAPRDERPQSYVIRFTTRSSGSTADVLRSCRMRWQIELAFKRLKSLLHIDRLPTRTEQASRSWLYAHLIMALLCDDLSQDFLESFP